MDYHDPQLVDSYNLVLTMKIFDYLHNQANYILHVVPKWYWTPTSKGSKGVTSQSLSFEQTT
jgi:hypothetical protein